MMKKLIILLGLVCSIGVYGQKIADLPDTTATKGSDLLIVDQSDSTRNITVSNFFGTVPDSLVLGDLATSNTTVLSPTSTGKVDTLETADITEVTLDSIDANYIEANSQVVVKGAGTVALSETTTPTALADYGKVYTKSDNELYFQDGAGVEHLVSLGASDYGEMGNVYGSSATEAIATADQWTAMYHANITGSAPHLNSGFSFVAGTAGAISATSTGAGATVTMTSAAHTLAANDWITINGTTTYNGVEMVDSINGNDFYITATNSEADEGGGAAAFQEGSYLLCATTGLYRGMWSCSFSQSLNNSETSIISPFVNGTQSTKATASRLLANNTDVGAIGGNGIMSFTAGDRIWFGVQTTAAQTLTFIVRNVSIH